MSFWHCVHSFSSCARGEGGSCRLSVKLSETFYGLAVHTDTRKVARAIVEHLTDAACYTAKWLKSSIAGCVDIDPRTPCRHNWSSNPFVAPSVFMHHAIRVNHTEIRCQKWPSRKIACKSCIAPVKHPWISRSYASSGQNRKSESFVQPVTRPRGGP